MESIWTTIGTILATGIVLYGGHFLMDYLQGKRESKKQILEKERETRDARRKYRENMVKPITDALNKLETSSSFSDLINTMSNAKDQGIIKEQESIEKIKWLEEFKKDEEAKNLREIYTEIIPLTSTITNKEVREAVNTALLYILLSFDNRELPEKIKKDKKHNIMLAYQKLEDFVTLAN